MNAPFLTPGMAESETLTPVPAFDVILAARHLHDAATLWFCTPHYPELAAVRESRREIYEAAKERMREALS